MIVTKGGGWKPPRVIIYSAPKVGKSTFGSESEAPIFVLTEDGISNLAIDQTPMAKTWDEFLSNIKSVATEKHSYKTLVIDTLNGAAALAAQHVCRKFFKDDWGPKGFAAFGQGWSATSEEMRALIDPLDACRERGMWILMLAHTGLQSVKNPLEGDYTKYAPDVDRKIWARFHGWADIILRADFEYTVLSANGGKGKAIGTSTRVLRSEGSAAEDAGCRIGYNLPPTIPLEWHAFTAALGQVSPLVQGIKDRWPLLADKEAADVLKWLGISSLDQIANAPSQKLASILNRLKAKEISSHVAA